MSLQTIELGGTQQPSATVMVLHGLGADGTDFLPLADEMKLDAPGMSGPVRWVFPRAKVRPVTINNGYRMRAWYDVLGTDLAKREDEAGLRESFADVHALLDREVALGVPASRIVLAGFSQGCAITLGAGLRYKHRLAGLVGLSGYLPLSSTLAAERHDANALTPVFIGHGIRDAVVTLARGQQAREAVSALGNPVQWHDYPMEHSVCPEEIQDMQAFIRSVLQPNAIGTD